MKQQKDFSEKLTNIVNLLNVGEVAIALQSAKGLLAQAPNDLDLQISQLRLSNQYLSVLFSLCMVLLKNLQVVTV